MNMRLNNDDVQSGFTMIELMISIVLGLLVIAAVTQVLISSQTSIASQQAGSDIQADGIFGMDTLKRSIRALGYGALPDIDGKEFVMSDTTPGGGVVLTVAASAAKRPESNVLPIVTEAAIKENLISTSHKYDTNLKPDSGTLKSDQLVIQRKLVSDTFDCEGNAVNEGFYLVERYFLRKDDETARSNEPEPLALACNAVSYGVDSGSGTVDAVKEDTDTSATFAFIDGTTPIKQKGTILMNRVDHFHYLLGIETGADVLKIPDNSRVRYMSASDYKSLPNPKPRIAAIRIGLVVRSVNPTNAGVKNTDQTFNVLDQKKLTLKTSVASKAQFQRQVYETTVLIRNGRGA